MQDMQVGYSHNDGRLSWMTTLRRTMKGLLAASAQPEGRAQGL
jgi:hypothetical protein